MAARLRIWSTTHTIHAHTKLSFSLACYTRCMVHDDDIFPSNIIYCYLSFFFQYRRYVCSIVFKYRKKSNLRLRVLFNFFLYLFQFFFSTFFCMLQSLSDTFNKPIRNLLRSHQAGFFWKFVKKLTVCVSACVRVTVVCNAIMLRRHSQRYGACHLGWRKSN